MGGGRLGEGGGDDGGGVLDDEFEVREVLGEGAGGVACGTADLVGGVRGWMGGYRKCQGRGERTSTTTAPSGREAQS